MKHCVVWQFITRLHGDTCQKTPVFKQEPLAHYFFWGGGKSWGVLGKQLIENTYDEVTCHWKNLHDDEFHDMQIFIKHS